MARSECVYTGSLNGHKQNVTAERGHSGGSAPTTNVSSLFLLCQHRQLTGPLSQDAIMHRLASIEATMQSFATQLERLATFFVCSVKADHLSCDNPQNIQHLHKHLNTRIEDSSASSKRATTQQEAPAGRRVRSDIASTGRTSAL